jgi:hypothetical protein
MTFEKNENVINLDGQKEWHIGNAVQAAIKNKMNSGCSTF